MPLDAQFSKDLAREIWNEDKDRGGGWDDGSPKWVKGSDNRKSRGKTVQNCKIVKHLKYIQIEIRKKNKEPLKLLVALN